MNAGLISFVTSFFCSLLIVRYSHLHAQFTSDSDISSVQKFHEIPVPRVGGIAIILAITATLLFSIYQGKVNVSFNLYLILAALPAFLFGLTEDITKKVGVKLRLAATFLSALLAMYFFDIWLTRTGLEYVDLYLLEYGFMSIAFTCFAVGGISNSFNIIDGYNGLSGVVATIILIGISYIAFKVGDAFVLHSALALIGAITGFLLWNYPFGRLFLGDGGAYLIGFWVAELSILLVMRNSQVSPWFPFLLCMYPITETIFTIYRRVILRRIHPGIPDACHLHQLIYRRLVRPNSRPGHSAMLQRNSMTSPYLWVLCLTCAVPAIVFWDNNWSLIVSSGIFVVLYGWVYWSIVRLRVPDYLKIGGDEE